MLHRFHRLWLIARTIDQAVRFIFLRTRRRSKSSRHLPALGTFAVRSPRAPAELGALATRVRYFVWLQHAQPLHLQGFSQPHSGEQRHPSFAAAEQAQAARLHFLQEHSWVVFMTFVSPRFC
jgi:hypothetical protein